MLRCGLLPLSSLCFVYLLCFSTNLTVLGDGPYECSQGGHGPHDLVENGVMKQKYMWYKRGAKTYVPVVLDHSYSYNEHSVIVGGLHEIQQQTCIEFDIYDNEAEVEEKDYVYINKNTKRGCYSYIGRIGGKQEIGLPIGCISHRTAMHEMLHALGFRHEHVRYDRDEYVMIMWGNIRQGRESNFKKRSPSDLVSGPYDYESIMHYERKAFSRNGKETIRPLKLGAKIGVRQQMSYWDAKKVNIVYKCGGSYSNSDVSDLLEHSPVLLDYEGHDRNESLPIAEFDDFNREPVTSPSHGREVHSRPDHDHDHDHDHHDDLHPHFDHRPPPQRQRPGPQHHNHNFNENERDNELHSYPDEQFGNNDNNNRIHYRNNGPLPRPRQQHQHHEEQFNQNPGGEDFLTYLTDTSSNPNSNNNNNNGGPFYEDFYDF